jgi:HAD superfamily hydrolase (TIGR01549 family)
MLRALLFDLDDTLLETHHAHQAALSTSCARAAERHPEWTVEALVGIFTETYRRLEDDLEAGRIKFATQLLFRTQTWQETLAACGLPQQIGEELALVYLEKRRSLYQLYDDVPENLAALGQEYRLVLVTNGLSDLQREKIAAVKLERWIQNIVVSGEVDSWKPDPGIFHHALGLAGVQPHEAVMIGDSLTRDIVGAAGVGIPTVWMRRYPHLEPMEGIRPDAEVTDLPSFRTWLTT